MGDFLSRLDFYRVGPSNYWAHLNNRQVNNCSYISADSKEQPRSRGVCPDMPVPSESKADTPDKILRKTQVSSKFLIPEIDIKSKLLRGDASRKGNW